MKPVRVNADYEMVLFEKKNSPAIVNQSLEFLALFLEDRPLCSSKKYTSEYLEHVETITHRKPVFSEAKDCENWWGKLQNIPLEQKLNSKEFSAAFESDTQIISSLDELNLEADQTYLAKNPFGMSGQNLVVFTKGEEHKIEQLLSRTKKLVIEPFFERVHDFSHYVLPDGKLIAYENMVDKNFQYKGTVFNNLNSPDVENLSFYNDVRKDEWKSFISSLENIRTRMNLAGGLSGYSIDSFTYRTGEGLKIRHVCEINYRKTMGLISWLLAQKFSRYPWTMFILGKSMTKENIFKRTLEQVRQIPDCLYLSPGDTRFELFFITGKNREEGMKKFEQLKKSLPDTEFAV